MDLDKHKCICKEGQKDKCILHKKNKIYSVYGGDANTNYVLNNLKQMLVNQYVVDDCLLKKVERGSKCDFLFTVKQIKNNKPEIKVAYLIECKGAELLKALKQIDSSYEKLKLGFNNAKLKGRIVTSKVYTPNIRVEAFKKLKLKLHNELLVKNKVLKETIKL